MKVQGVTVVCGYNEEGQDARALILQLFADFLRREQDKLADGCPTMYNRHDEWPLISGGIRCTRR